MSPEAASITVVAATLAGNTRTNQDHVVLTPHAVAVLDGATSWLPQDPARDGGWYARSLGAALTTRLEDGTRTLTDIVADSIAEVRDRFELTPGECPTSTVTIVRWNANGVEVYTLGDSPAVVFRPDADPVVVYDERLESVGAEHREIYRAHLRAGRGYGEELSEMIGRMQLAERAQRNRPGGYWIAGSDPSAAERAVTARFHPDEARQVLIASDGAAADVMEYRRHTWCEVPEIVTKASPAEYLQGIHAAEEADHDGVRWPRPKRHDDKTLAVISLGRA